MSSYDDEEERTPEQEALAKEFEELCASVRPQIKVKIDLARQALKEAQDIAEEHGVPFRSGISPLSNSFVPSSFSKSKFTKLNREDITEIADVWGDYIGELLGGHGGWVHSAVC